MYKFIEKKKHYKVQTFLLERRDVFIWYKKSTKIISKKFHFIYVGKLTCDKNKERKCAHDYLIE